MGLFSHRQTIIKFRHGGEIDKAIITALRLNDNIGTKMDFQKEASEIISIGVQTSRLKKAITSDETLRGVLRSYEELELVDLLPPRPLKLSGPRIAEALPVRVYIKSTMDGEETARISTHKNVDDAKRKLEDFARWIPAGILAALVGGVLYMGVRTANIAIKTVQDAADQNNKMTDIKIHGKDGLSEVLEQRSGRTSPSSQPASQPSFQQAEEGRRGTNRQR